LCNPSSTPPPRREDPSLSPCPGNTTTTTSKNHPNPDNTTTPTTDKSTNNPPSNANFSNPNRTDKRTEQRQDFQRINALLVKMYVYAARHALLPAAETQPRKS
jgi:heme-binding NEAT domain protein